MRKLNDEEITKSANEDAKKEAENAEILTRKQWKNKIKNKKKCKNKYRLNQPEEDVDKSESIEKQIPKEEVIIQSHSNKGEKTIIQAAALKKEKEKERKPQKRKKTEEDGEEKQPAKMEKQTKTQNRPESPADGIKLKLAEPEGEITDQRVPEKKPKPELSKEQNLKREKLRKLLNCKETEPEERREEATPPQQETPEVLEAPPDRSASLRSRMELRLEAARFRYINELLYTTSSGEARRMFKQDPQAFWIYHKGYTAQVQRWPANPVDAIIAYIQQK